MSKLEKDIIFSINNRKSHGNVIFQNNGFYLPLKGILQNFAILTDDDTLIIRIDKSSYNASKRIFKRFNELDDKYYICLGTDRVSQMMINKGYTPDDFLEDLPSLFHLYTHEMMIIFKKNNISFKELIFNTINYFDVLDEFNYMIVTEGHRFWVNVNDRYPNSYNWHHNKNHIEPNDLELDELNESDWVQKIAEIRRTNIIDDILR